MSAFVQGAGPDHRGGNTDKCIYYITENRLDVHGKAGAFFFSVLKYVTIVNCAAGKDVLAMTSRLKYRGRGEAQKVLVPGAAGTVALGAEHPASTRRSPPPQLRGVFYLGGKAMVWSAEMTQKFPASVAARLGAEAREGHRVPGVPVAAGGRKMCNKAMKLPADYIDPLHLPGGTGNF